MRDSFRGRSVTSRGVFLFRGGWDFGPVGGGCSPVGSSRLGIPFEAGQFRQGGSLVLSWRIGLCARWRALSSRGASATRDPFRGRSVTTRAIPRTFVADRTLRALAGAVLPRSGSDEGSLASPVCDD